MNFYQSFDISVYENKIICPSWTWQGIKTSSRWDGKLKLRRFICYRITLLDFMTLHGINKIFSISHIDIGFPCGSAGKESACNVGDLGSIPRLGRSPGEGNSYPLQYSGLENYTGCIAHGVAKSWTQLSEFHFHIYLTNSLSWSFFYDPSSLELGTPYRNMWCFYHHSLNPYLFYT